MLIKIANKNHYIICDFDIENKIFGIDKEKSKPDKLLKILFYDKDYQDFVFWIDSRTNNASLEDVIEMIDKNNLFNAKDSIKIFRL